MKVASRQKDETFSFEVATNDNYERVEFYIRGEFPSPAAVSDAINAINQLSDSYNTIIVYINSPGGTLMTAVEIVSALRRYKNIITVGTGDVSSAGFLIWSLGHIRVAQDYTSFMSHRESYGYKGKTSNHLEMAQHSNKLYSKLYDELFSDILTPEERKMSENAEVFLTSNELIERGVAISWDRFLKAERGEIETETIITVDGKSYHVIDDDYVMTVDEETDKPVIYSYIDVVYGLPTPRVYKKSEATEEDLDSTE